MRLGLLIAILAFVTDQLSKIIILEKVFRPESVFHTPFFSDKVVEIFPFLNLRLVWNTGISFSMFASDSPITLIILTSIQIVIVVLLIWFMSKEKSFSAFIAFGLIIGGALGNILDRLMYGAVMDFIDFFIGAYHFPTFNIADTMITVGVIIWFLTIFFSNDKIRF